MTEIEFEDNRIRGFAAIINNVVSPLNNNNQFKEKFKSVHVKILLNAPNVNFAALIIIDHGEITVKSIPNKPRENLTKEQVGWDGFVEMNSQSFIAISMDRLPLFKVVIKWIRGEIKMRGIRKLLYLLKAFKYLM
jgi:hypothetical protein